MSNRPRTNPHLGEHFYDALKYVSPGHPAAETPMLTPYQQMALPVLLWLLDPSRNRGEGRSTLMAHAAIELAMRGHVVPLEDFSQFLSARGDKHRQARYFVDLVMRLIHEHYPGHLFNLQQPHGYGIDRELVYVGRRPR